MGKRTQELLVCLDQNFLGGVSRAAGNEKLRPFKDIYQLLRQGSFSPSRGRSARFAAVLLLF
jgi:hypothetical protein